MAKFHVNPNNGNVGSCRALLGRCPYGNEEDHYETAGQAREAFEASHGGSFNFARQPSPQAQKIFDKIISSTLMGGSTNAVAYKEMASVAPDEWPLLAREAQEEYDGIAAQLKEIRNSNSSSYNGDPNYRRLQTLGENAFKRLTVSNAGLEWSRASKDGEITVPAGFKRMPAVFDLEGNFIGPGGDTYYAPRTLTTADGRKIKYRASRHSDPEKRRAAEAKKGYYSGEALLPVGVQVNYNEKRGYEFVPAFSEIRRDRSLVTPIDNGQA